MAKIKKIKVNDTVYDVGAVTGVKGNSESSYRTGDVNLTAANIGAVPTGRTVNNKALSSNITLSASDVGADAAGTAETKANAALASAKSYADGIKNSLLNGAGDAYDTLKELGDLISANDTAIDALETVAAGKASASDLTAHTGNKSNPHGVTAAQVGALPASGGTVSGDLTVTGKITQGTPSSDDTVASMNRFKADLFVEGSGTAPNNPRAAGFYLGKSQTDDNRHMDIVSAGDYSYIDFNQASHESDYDARLLVNVNTGDTQWMWGPGITTPIFNVMGYLRKNGVDVATVNDLGGHTGDKSNPHGVTAEQVGAYTKAQVDSAFAKITSISNDWIDALIPEPEVS